MKCPGKNTWNILLFVVWLGLGLALTTADAEELEGGANPGRRETLVLAFISHLDASLPEQDVFIERKGGSGMVYRVTIGDRNMTAPLYKSATPLPRNPFNAADVGPFPKGEPLGMTLGDWLGHSGTGAYTCVAGEGRLDAQFEGLVKNGVYTIWHAFTAIPATRPFSGFLELPLGARDGSTSVFVADEMGSARLSRRFSPCLQMSDLWTTSLLAIHYHSDGRTYAGRPGAFGYNVHVPLFVTLPPRADLEPGEQHPNPPAPNETALTGELSAAEYLNSRVGSESNTNYRP